MNGARCAGYSSYNAYGEEHQDLEQHQQHQGQQQDFVLPSLHLHPSVDYGNENGTGFASYWGNELGDTEHDHG